MTPYIRDIRSDLISNHRFRQTEGLRRLYVELLESGDLWADRIGYASRVDVREGFAAGFVELVLILAFEDEWPGGTGTLPAVGHGGAPPWSIGPGRC